MFAWLTYQIKSLLLISFGLHPSLKHKGHLLQQYPHFRTTKFLWFDSVLTFWFLHFLTFLWCLLSFSYITYSLSLCVFMLLKKGLLHTTSSKSQPLKCYIQRWELDGVYFIWQNSSFSCSIVFFVVWRMEPGLTQTVQLCLFIVFCSVNVHHPNPSFDYVGSIEALTCLVSSNFRFCNFRNQSQIRCF